MADHDAQYWAARKCMREPVPAIFQARQLLSEAADAHLAGNAQLARQLLIQADLPDVRAWTESLWGSVRAYPDQVEYKRFRACADAPPHLPKADRIPLRMPSPAEKRSIIERYGRHCVFCGVPLISAVVRRAFHRWYPLEVPWGSTNVTQHAAFQCMWLQFDHLLPHSRGGDNSIENVVVTCAPCNFARMDYTLEELGLLDPRNHVAAEPDWDGLERVK